MPKLYMDQLQWKHWPMTLGVTSKGLRVLEFKSMDEIADREKKRNPELEVVLDKKAAAPYRQQVEQYFEGDREVFDVPLDLNGTAFQLRVWHFLLSIPYGKVACYQEAAEAAGNVKAVRAAGMANNRNPVSVVVPCHRVVGKNGALVGYGGGLDMKEALLSLEGISVDNKRITEASAWMKNR